MLHLAHAQQTGEHRPCGSAASSAATAAARVDAPKIVAGPPPSTAQTKDQAGDAATPAVPTDASTTKLAAWVPSGAAPSGAERELTFAWGYAQRHPEALARGAESNAAAVLAGGPTRRTERLSKREPARPAGRERAAVVHHDTVGVAPSGFFADVDRDARQAPSDTEPRIAKGARPFGRAQASPNARHRSFSSSPHA